MQSDRLPPQNIESEEAILGGILLDPEAINRVTELLHPEFFAIQAHQIIYKAMCQLYSQGKPTDLMTVTSWLSDHNQLEKIGGRVKIVQLLERTVSAVNIDQYAALVLDKYIRRKLIQAGNEIFDLGFQTATKLETILDQAEQKIFALTQDKPQQDLVPISETLINTFQEIEDRNEGVALPGLPCGFYDLDAMTGGFQRSDLIIVAGRPSMGKCAAYDTLVLQKDGSLVTLAEVYQRQEIELLTLGKNSKFYLTKPSAFIDDGIKPIFRVTTKLGRFVETTITHPFLTVNGWKPLAKLQVGEKIAVPRRLNIFGNETISESKFSSLINFDNLYLFPLVFQLERSQLALFIRYLFSLDGWVKIYQNKIVCFGYSTVSEKLIRQIQHILLRFGIVSGIEKVEEKRTEKIKVVKEVRSQRSYKEAFTFATYRNCYCDGKWHLTITDAFSQKNLMEDIGDFDSKNFYLFDLSQPHNSSNQELKNYLIFWDELVNVLAQFASSKNQSLKNQTAKGKSPKNSENLTTTETICRKNILANTENLPSENQNFDSEKFDLPQPHNSGNQELENSDIFWDKIVSIEPVGEKQVYDLTVPETHNFVANDICLHNTSFAVNIAHSIAANLKLPIAIFSLEMSKEQLVLRLLASEAKIESNRLRAGRISQNEWEPLTSAITTLSEMPIFIDDTPNITVNEIRSKTRQLQSEQGGALGLILLDYLQLMEGNNSDNRVLELARITRNLKGLARELSVPIIALSQLSRSVEARTNKRPMMSDLRESGCLTGESLICLADGKKVPISCLVGSSNFAVLALNENTWKFESAMVSRVFSTGVKPIFSLQTSSGKLIRATANHPFFSMGGWKQLNTLNIGDSLAILNQKMLKCSILYDRYFLSQGDFGPKYGGNLGSIVKSREWERSTEIDVEWDEIVEIMPHGEAEVFDLTVPGLHNFVANEIVVHNSIEQDADIVIMLYRDEYYSPDTPDQGIAEVIITKHRNGPTGTVKLLFDPQFTKFRNLAVDKR
ncbi:MAG: replicative DNA helicase [Trichodesmium sp. MAG_R01]|nr:replicative DNA helicase [Trichodesmium sp. MAG_R01]